MQIALSPAEDHQEYNPQNLFSTELVMQYHHLRFLQPEYTPNLNALSTMYISIFGVSIEYNLPI